MEKTLQNDTTKLIVKLEKVQNDEIAEYVYGRKYHYELTVETCKKERFGIHTEYMTKDVTIKTYQFEKKAIKAFDLINL